MKNNIYYALIILFTVLSMPLRAAGFDEVAAVVSTTEVHVVDINLADIETLALLKGVGEKRAKAIVAYRESNGQFNSVDDLLNVKGVGEHTLQLNKGRIKL
ncbi:helix-hairpin-helix domain-containing protein [Colwellia sp. 6M3]|jgi:competence protein ComEA|uniref:ComEA family DNA-binding protein n=1 Tax=Colwellia sp. 6M3 TaxID=2759849 RepID=UPI0015F3EB3F|nr:ComEA family DNA-binding protein [Colwellia sp. 6M3]MBA6417585.1 helix-hairpin-helix domain-containing protein [Colwellia sp. 6M3]